MTPYFRKVSLIVASLGLLVSLVFALRADEDDDRTPVIALETVSTSEERSTGAPPEVEPAPVVVDVDASSGAVVRRTVERGDRVVFNVTSEVADRVHLHGYDVFVDATPGRPATISFDAHTPGRFEIELEDASVLIAELEVRP